MYSPSCKLLLVILLVFTNAYVRVSFNVYVCVTLLRDMTPSATQRFRFHVATNDAPRRFFANTSLGSCWSNRLRRSLSSDRLTGHTHITHLSYIYIVVIIPHTLRGVIVGRDSVYPLVLHGSYI